MRHHLPVLIALASCATAPAPIAHAPAPAPDPLRAAAHRDRPALLPLLAHADPAVRAGAVLGMGRLQDPADGPRIAAALADPAPAVRSAAAEALGLLGLAWDEPTADQRRHLLAALVQAATTETDAGVRARIAWAAGRAGSEGAGAAVLRLLSDPDAGVRAQAAFSAGIVARFHAPADPAALSRAVLELAGDPDAEVRAAVAFASIYLPAAEVAPLEKLAADDSGQVRAFAARALGVAGGSPARLETLAADPEVRVRVEAVRGLQVLAGRKDGAARAAAAALDRLARTLGEGERREGGARFAQPLELLVRPSAGETTAGTAGAVLRALGDPRSAALPADAARLRCLAAAAADRAARRVKEIRGCGAGLAPPALEERLEASVLGDLDTGTARLEELAGPGHDPSVRMAALEALGKRAGQGAGAVAAALGDADPAVVAAAAEAVAARKDPSLRSALLEALIRCGEESATEAAQSILSALGALGADDAARGAITAALADPRSAVRTSARRAFAAMGAPPPEPPSVTPRLHVPGPSEDRPRHVRVQTGRGVFTFALDDEAAPVTAESFRRLVRMGYFDGITFHRVEPGFVVQGGDPRGDGTGGPGFAIPCENAATPYDRGTVGMALSGKDTGGSQWFVTYGRTPHLEGRYTAFGRVVAGMDVVETLLAGDRMSKVTLEP